MTENKPKNKTYTMRISIELYEKLERKHAIELAEAGQLIHTPSSTSLL